MSESITNPPGDVFDSAAAAAAPPPPEPPKKRGGARPGAGRKPKNGARAAAPAASLPYTPSPPPPPPIEPLTPELKEYYSTLLKRFDRMLLGDLNPRIEPLSETEAAEGAEVLHPLVSAYMHKLADPRVQFALWLGVTYLPRGVEYARGYRAARIARQAQRAVTPDAPRTEGAAENPFRNGPSHDALSMGVVVPQEA